MLPYMPLFDTGYIRTLHAEFRGSMRVLWRELCQDLERDYPDAAVKWGLVPEWLCLVGEHIPRQAYSRWKVVGWIEELNEALYFFDVRRQFAVERNKREFVDAFFSDSEERFYEHGYFEDLFPGGIPEVRQFSFRLDRLCARLSRGVMQESLFLIPGLPCKWLADTKRRSWRLDVSLGPSFERAELPGTLPIGLDGGYLVLPVGIKRRLERGRWRGTIIVDARSISIRVGRETTTILTVDKGEPLWKVPCRASLPLVTQEGDSADIRLGPTLVYGKDRSPGAVVESRLSHGQRLRAVLHGIHDVWPDGAGLLWELTSRIVPLRAHGVVSFSYRHRPGLSFINFFDRNQLDLIDDVIHENSHHHLNLLLRKFRMRGKDRHEEIFYSPWRRSLRPMHGILHATFTFTAGAMLFARLGKMTFGSITEATRWRRAMGLNEEDLLRAKFRCLQEVASVQYSLRDLRWAVKRLGWLRPPGVALVQALQREIRKVGQVASGFHDEVMRSRYGVQLRTHEQELRKARERYGPGK